MKVKNTSRRVIDLLRGKEKITTVPGSGQEYEVTDCPDVQWYIERGDLIEVYSKPGRKAKADEGEEKPLTVAQIKEALAAQDVEIPEGVTKRDDLLALLEAADSNENDE
ncbi:hypothetical protein ACMHYO_14295 [Allopusillimonas ginsengisoli]|uniref:hypothetical protein n=1 Tax=Allopusillimonas ginsengisoli TaxID=453575 RepID=UPI0039C019FE